MNSSSEMIFHMTCELFGRRHIVVNKLPSERYSTSVIVVMVLNSILIVPTIFLNAVAITTIVSSSQLNHKPCYFIILVQSILDVAVGALAQPLFLGYLSSKLGGVSSCIAAFLAFRVIILTSQMSMTTLSAMTVERYIAILHPFSYVKVTIQRIMVCVSLASSLVLALVLTSIAVERILGVYATIQSAIFFVFTAFAYSRIFLVLKNISRLEHRSVGVSSGSLTRTILFVRKIKQARSCFVVVLCYMVLHFLPVNVTMIFRETMHVIDFQACLIWATLMGMLNASLNSIIFFWTKTMLRKEAVRVIKIFRSSTGHD